MTDTVIISPAEKRRLRAQSGGKAKHGLRQEAEALAQRVKVATLAEHIREVVESAPAPTPDQLNALRALLPVPSTADGEAAA